MKTSAAGIEIIKRNEGCRLTAYLDTIASPPVWTIGYGETGPYVYEGLRYTQDQADMGLARRLAAEFEPGVLAAIGDAPTSQAQLDAMVSLAWNIGVPAFARSTVARLHKASQYAGAADAFRMWNKAGGKVIQGLVRRRDEERSLYLSDPVPPAVSPEPATLDPALVADAIAVLTRLQAALAELPGNPAL